MNDLFGVYGAGGCGRGVMPLVRHQIKLLGHSGERAVFIDDEPVTEMVNGHHVVSFDQFMEIPTAKRYAAIAIADGAIRETLALRLASHGVEPLTVRGSSLQVMDEVTIGPGAILSPFVTLTSNIRIGRFFHANLYSYVEHDCVIGDFVTFAPGVKCNGNVLVEDFSYIGAGAILRQGRPGEPLVIGRGAVVGMGAVVTKSVPPGVTVVGNPARPLAR